MKILFFGAGVIGKVYATRLYESGLDVTLLARGKNYELIKQKGIEILNVQTNSKISQRVPVVSEIGKNINYDLLIVTVRLDQMDSVMDILNSQKSITTILFMLNNTLNSNDLKQRFPDKRIILGFPGIAGILKENIIEYIEIKEQKTTIGQVDHDTLNLTKKIKEIFSRSGFKTAISKNMDWWLKTHAIFISCASASIENKDGNSIAFGGDKQAIGNFVTSVQEGFRCLQKNGIEVTPKNLRTIFLIMPKWFSTWYWSKAMKGKLGTIAIASHAKAAKSEMQLIAKNVLSMTSKCHVSTLKNLLTEYVEA